jgi:hypothetical protein
VLNLRTRLLILDEYLLWGKESPEHLRRCQTMALLALTIFSLLIHSAAHSQVLPPADELVFKGTHNSYGCPSPIVPEGPLLVQEADFNPRVQVDDFGAWIIELDFGIKADETGKPRAVVGHGEPGDGTCPEWGYYLVTYLENLRRARALKYRPLFLNLDAKDDWEESPFREDEEELRKQKTREIAEKDVSYTFLDRIFDLPQQGPLPSIPELAGKVIIRWGKFHVLSTWDNGCVSRSDVENSIRTGKKLQRTDEEPTHCTILGHIVGCRWFRLEQYRHDWTFGYGVPPNPIIVDFRAPSQPAALWECHSEEKIHWHGTYLFPYPSLSWALARVEGKLNPEDPQGDANRSGYGWTIIVHPGHYREKINVDFPVTIEKCQDVEGCDGEVLIGQ